MKCSVYWFSAFVAITVLISAIHFAECKPTTGDTTPSEETSTAGLSVEGTTGKSTGFWEAIGKQESISQSHSHTPNEPEEDDYVDVDMVKENEKKAGKKLPDFRWTLDPNTMTEDIQITINFGKNSEIIKVVKLIRNLDGSVREDVERTLYPKGELIVFGAINQEDDDDDDDGEGMFVNKGVMPSAESNPKIDPGSEGIFGNTFASTEEPVPIKSMDIEDTTTYPLIPRLGISSTEKILEETSTEIETEGKETDSSAEETESTTEEKAEESSSNNVPTTSAESDDDDEKSTKTPPTTDVLDKETSTESPSEEPASTGEVVKTKESLASTEKENDATVTEEPESDSPTLAKEREQEETSTFNRKATTIDDELPISKEESRVPEELKDETKTDESTKAGEEDSSSKEGDQSPPPQSETTTNHPHHLHHKGDGHETGDAKWDEIERDSNKDAGNKKKKGKKGNTTTALPAPTDIDDDSNDDDSNDDDSNDDDSDDDDSDDDDE